MTNSNVTITVYSENKPGMLYRVANLLLRRKINVESLTVSEIKNEGLSRFTIVVRHEISIVQKVAKQIERIIEVSKVEIHTDEELIYREAAIIKIVKNQSVAKKVKKIIKQLNATIINKSEKYVVIEKLGAEEDLDLLVSALEPFIKEVVRSGRIALPKNGH